jgi:hypothetical protein
VGGAPADGSESAACSLASSATKLLNPGGMQRDGDAVRRDIRSINSRSSRAPRASMTCVSSGAESSAAVLSRCTGAMVRALISGDASSRRTCPSTRPSSLAAIERTGQVSWPLRLAPRQTCRIGRRRKTGVP